MGAKMETMLTVFIVLLCGSVISADEKFEDESVKIALKVYDDCSIAEVFSSCLKKKAINFLDRIGRMEKLPLTDSIVIVRANDVDEDNGTNYTTKVNEAKGEILDEMLVNKVSRFIGARTLQIDLPRMISRGDLMERAGGDIFGSLGGGGGGGGHGHGGGGGGGGGGKRKKKKGDNSGMMMLIAAKFAALMALAVGGLFLLAKKALITAKIALLISGIIAIKKLFGNKGGSTRVEDVWASSSSHGGGGGGGGGWQSGGGGGGGGGWDKKSFRLSSLPYKAYEPVK